MRKEYRKLNGQWDNIEWVREYTRKRVHEWSTQPDTKKRLADKRHTEDFRKKRRKYMQERRAQERLAKPPKKRLPSQYKSSLQERARVAVRIAILHGKLQPGLCAHRDKDQCWGQLEGHHWKGYDPKNWLEVVWLCKRHHTREEWARTNVFLPYEPDSNFIPNLNTAWASWVTPDLKRCSKCGLPKPKGSYYKDSRKSDGLYAKCRQCHNEIAVAGRKKGPLSFTLVNL